MGIPMTKNLLKAGFPVTVYNRTPDKAKPLTDLGAKLADSAARLFDTCDVVVTMVSDDAAVKEIYTSENGLLTNPGEGKTAINTSTVSPETSRYLAEQCAQKGVAFLEAPVSGSVKPAEEGQLIILTGGPAEVYEKAKPILDCLSKLSLHLGDYGTGSVAKLAINLLVGFNTQGLAETLLFATKHGVDTKDMLTIINEGACGNGTTKAKTPGILSGEFPVAFSIKNYAKDLRLAKEVGADTPLAAAVHDSYQAALGQHMENEDVMAILKFLDR